MAKATEAEVAQMQAELESDIGLSSAKEYAKQFNQFTLNSLLQDTVLPDSYDEMLAFLEDNGVSLTEANEETVGDGFKRVDKKELINRPCVLINWQADNGTNRIKNEDGTETEGFLVVRGMAKDGLKFWFICGGYGIAAELKKVTVERMAADMPNANAGLILPKGLDRDELKDYPGNYIYKTAL